MRAPSAAGPALRRVPAPLAGQASALQKASALRAGGGASFAGGRPAGFLASREIPPRIPDRRNTARARRPTAGYDLARAVLQRRGAAAGCLAAAES